MIVPRVFLIEYGSIMSGACSAMSSFTLCAVFSLSLIAVACELKRGRERWGGASEKRKRGGKEWVYYIHV